MTTLEQDTPPPAGAAAGARAWLLARRRAILETLAVLSGAVAWAVFLTWPLAARIHDSIFGIQGDGTGTIALLRRWASTGFDITGTTHIAESGAPLGWDSGNAVNLQFITTYWPAHVLDTFVSATVAYNVVVIAGIALSGAAMYLLVRRLGCGVPVAMWSGIAFTTFPWLLERALGHASLTHLWGFPLLVLAIVSWAERPRLRAGLLVAFVVLLLWMTAGYFGVMGLLLALVALPLAGWRAGRANGWRPAVRQTAIAVGACLGATLLLAALARLGVNPNGQVAEARNVFELDTLAARPWEYVLPSYRSIVFGPLVDGFLIARQHGSNMSETSLFVGWLTLGLALAWLVMRVMRRGPRTPRASAATLVGVSAVVVAVLIAVPSPLKVAGLEIPMPSRVIFEFVPQFRVTSRAQALLMAGLVPLAALGLQALVARVAARRGRWATIGAPAVALVACGLTFAELSIVPGLPVSRVDDVPPEYVAVRRAPPGALAEYPLGWNGSPPMSSYLFYRPLHGRPIVNGAPDYALADALRQVVVDPLEPDTPRNLAALGVSVVTVRDGIYTELGGSPTPSPLNPPKGYRRIATASDGVEVWAVTARPAPAVAAFTEGWGWTQASPGGDTARWLATSGAEVRLLAPRAGTFRVTFPAGSWMRPRVVSVRGAGAAVARGTVQPIPARDLVTFNVRAPAGQSRLWMDVTPGPEDAGGEQRSVFVGNLRITRVPAPGATTVTAAPVPASCDLVRDCR